MTDPTEKRQNPYWLIERRDMQGQSAWLIVNGFHLSWTFTAIHATRFATEEEAAIERSDFREQMPDETWITEHLDV